MNELEDDIASSTNEVQGNTDITSGLSNVTDMQSDDPANGLAINVDDNIDPLDSGGDIIINDSVDPLDNGDIKIDDSVDPFAQQRIIDDIEANKMAHQIQEDPEEIKHAFRQAREMYDEYDLAHETLPTSPKPADTGGTSPETGISINSVPQPEEPATTSNEVFGNAGDDPYASYPDSHFPSTDQRHLDPQPEQTEMTNLKAVRELNNTQRD